MLTVVVTPQQRTVAVEMTAAAAIAMAAASMVAAMVAAMGDSSSDGFSNGQYQWQPCPQWQQQVNHGSRGGNDHINRRQQWAVAIGNSNGGCLDGDGCALSN